MRHLRLLAALSLAVTGAACGGSSSPPSPSPGGGSGETITGSERLGWNQRAADVGQLSTYQFAIYVDGVRNEARDATCVNSATSEGYACSAKLPSMSTGTHTLEVATYVMEGDIVESARSAPLQVTVRALTAPAADAAQKPSTVVAADGLVLTRSDVVAALDDPSDFAFAPDSRLFIAERGGRIRIATGGTLDGRAALVLDDALVVNGAGGVLALALDPDFARVRLVYVLHVVDGRRGPMFRLSRYREAGGALGERAVLLDRQPASGDAPSGNMRFGPDGKLYVLLDDGGDAEATRQAGTFNGKLLRLNADGTTPVDAPAASPVVAGDFTRPGGLDWQPASERLWTIDALPAASRLDAFRSGRRDGTALKLPSGSGGSMAFYQGSVGPLQGNLLVASPGRRELLRVRFRADDASRVASVETLLGDVDVRAVGRGSDGRLYVATQSEIWAFDR